VKNHCCLVGLEPGTSRSAVQHFNYLATKQGVITRMFDVHLLLPSCGLLNLAPNNVALCAGVWRVFIFVVVFIFAW